MSRNQGQQFSGRNVRVELQPSGYEVIFEEVNLNTEDGVTYVPGGGWVDGESTAEGEVVIDLTHYKTLEEIAKESGAWNRIPEQDISFVSTISGASDVVKAYGCKFKMPSNPVSAKFEGKEKMVRKIPFFVADSENFIEINDVVMAARSEQE